MPNKNIIAIWTFLLTVLLIIMGGCKTTVTKTIKQAPVTVTTTVTQIVTSWITGTSPISGTSSTLETKSITTQPQEITSRDGKLQIVEHGLTTEVSLGAPQCEVSGIVKNISSSAVSARIDAKFYDYAGVLVDSTSYLINDIPAGESRFFYLWATQWLDVRGYELAVNAVS